MDQIMELFLIGFRALIEVSYVSQGRLKIHVPLLDCSGERRRFHCHQPQPLQVQFPQENLHQWAPNNPIAIYLNSDILPSSDHVPEVVDAKEAPPIDDDS